MEDLAISPDFPNDALGRHHSTKRSHEIRGTHPPDLSHTDRIKALNLLHYHATHDLTSETLNAILQCLAAIPDTRSFPFELITESINSSFRLQHFRMVDTRLWAPISSSTSEETMEDEDSSVDSVE